MGKVNVTEERVELTALDKASAVYRQVAGEVRNLRSSVDSLKNSVAAVSAFVGGAAGAAGFIAWIKGAIDAEAAMGRLAKRSSESVEDFSAMAYAMKKAGDVDAETFQSSLKKLDKVIGEAAAGGKQAQAIFAALGVEWKDRTTGAVRKGTDVMLDLANVFAKAKDDPVKTAYALALMGKAGDEMIPGLSKGKEALQGLMEQAKEFGKVVTGEEYEAAVKFNKNLEDLASSSSKLGKSIANDLLPHLTRMTDEIIRGRKESGFFGGIVAGLGAYLFSVFDGVDQPAQRAARDVVKLDDELANLETTLRQMSSSVNPGVKARLEKEIAAKKAELEGAIRFFQQVQQGADKQAAADAAANKHKEDAKKSLDPSGLRNQGEAQAETKLYTHALQQLEEELGKLQDQSKSQLVINRVTSGSWKDLTLEHKAYLIAIAGEYDDLQLLLAQQKAFVQAWENEVSAVEAGRIALQDHTDARRLDIEELGRSITLVGASARVIEKLNAERQIELDIRRRIAALPRDQEGNLLPGAQAAEVEILRQGEAHKRAVVDLIEQRQAAERSWLTGAKQGFNEYADMATNAAAQTREAFMNAFTGIENVMVNFLRTGKLNFRDFANSVVDDLARMFVRQAITGPLSQAIGSAIFGSGGGVAGGAGIKALDVAAAAAGSALAEMDLSAVSVDVGFTALQTSTTVLDSAVVQATAALETFSAALEASAAGNGASGGAGALGLAGLFSGGSGSLAGGAGLEGAADVFGVTAMALAKDGGVMTDRGMVPLRRYAAGGIATRPQLAMFGEGSQPEAYVPLPDGRRIPVQMKGDGGDVINIHNTLNVDARSDMSSIRMAMEASKRATVAAIRDLRERGGR